MANEKRMVDFGFLMRYAECECDRTILKHGEKSDMAKWCRTALFVLKELLKGVPTVDAVEVVRCKDCKHCYKSSGSVSGYRCHCWGMWSEDHPVEPNGFCHIGERKDNDHT